MIKEQPKEQPIDIIVSLRSGGYFIMEVSIKDANDIIDRYIAHLKRIEEEISKHNDSKGNNGMAFFERWYRFETGEEKLPQLLLFSQVAGIQTRLKSLTPGEEWKKEK